MLTEELEELRDAVRAAELALENSRFEEIDRNLAYYIKKREEYSKGSR